MIVHQLYLKYHININMNSPKLSFSNLCHIIVNNYSEMYKGIYSFNDIICEELNDMMLTNEDNNQNKHTHPLIYFEGTDIFTCTYCNIKFSQSENLQLHQTKHTEVRYYNDILDKSESDIFYSSFESNNLSEIYMSDTSVSFNSSTSQYLNNKLEEYCFEDSQADYYNISIDVPLANEDNQNIEAHKPILPKTSPNKNCSAYASVKNNKIIKISYSENNVNIKIKLSNKYFKMISVSYKSFRNFNSYFTKSYKISSKKFKKT